MAFMKEGSYDVLTLIVRGSLWQWSFVSLGDTQFSLDSVSCVIITTWEYLHSGQTQFSQASEFSSYSLQWMSNLILSWKVLFSNDLCGAYPQVFLLSTCCWILPLLQLKFPLAPPPHKGVSECTKAFPPSWLPSQGSGHLLQILCFLLLLFFCLFVCLFFNFYLLPYLILRRLACLFGSLRSSASVQKVFCEICSTCWCIFDEFVSRKVITWFYTSTILKIPNRC